MRPFTLLSLLLYLCGAALAVEAPRTVKDFLLLLPEKYLGFEGAAIPATERLAMIEADDTANGWLRLAGRGENTFEGWIDLALFRPGPEGPMIGVTVNYCGPLCRQQVFFLKFARETWAEITAKVWQPLPGEKVKELYRACFPDDEFADDPPVLYRLPRRGTDIVLVTQEAIAGKEIVLARLRLRNGRFLPGPV